jgi:circadian clock protein KaiB
LKVVDIYKHPEQAEADQVAATPTLVKVWPKPVRRIAGNLEDAAKILQMLSTS